MWLRHKSSLYPKPELLPCMGSCTSHLLPVLSGFPGCETSPKWPKSGVNLPKTVYYCHFPADKKLFADKNNPQFHSVMIKKKKELTGKNSIFVEFFLFQLWFCLFSPSGGILEHWAEKMLNGCCCLLGTKLALSSSGRAKPPKVRSVEQR